MINMREVALLKCPETLHGREELLKADGHISRWNWQTGRYSLPKIGKQEGTRCQKLAKRKVLAAKIGKQEGTHCQKLANRKVLASKNSTEHRDLGNLDRILNANGETRLR